MPHKFFLPLCLALATLAAQAQPTPAKQELLSRILKLQQPGIEAMARGLAEQPAAIILAGMS